MIAHKFKALFILANLAALLLFGQPTAFAAMVCRRADLGASPMDRLS